MTPPPSNESSSPPPDLHDLLDHAARCFVEKFGRPPTAAAQAPGRVNLIGEHTDYNDGFVLPMAIDRQAVIVGAPGDDGHSRFWSVDLNAFARLDLGRPLLPHEQRWVNYLLGVVDQFQSAEVDVPNMNLVLHSAVPIGAGLSSSAAIEVAMATFLEELCDHRLDPQEKVLLCRRAEHAFPGTPCGIMDMFVATRGVADHALLIDCRSLEYRAIRLDDRRASVLLVNTGVTHDLAAGAYADRQAICRRVADAIGVEALRDATLAMLTGVELTVEQSRRASHVITENTRTLLAAKALHEGDYGTLGDLMFASHDSLRDLYEVSCEELDHVVEIARSLRDEEGMFGARMTGGGFGGCAILLCRPESARRTAAAIRSQYVARFGETPDVFAVTPAGGARPLAVPRATP